MVKGIKFRRGTTADHSTFTGQEGEITVDITKDVAIVHDGTTVGGFPLVGETATQRITNKDINATALNVIGVITATSFIGDGSQLTGIVGSGIVIKDDGILIGTASTIDFGANLSVSPVSAGIVTVTGAAGGGGSSQWVTTAVGIHTLSKVGIGTTNPTSALTVQGNVSVSGFSTFTNSINLNSGNIKVATDGIIKVGNSDQLEIYYNGGTGQTIKSTGDLRILTSRLLLNNAANDEQLIEANQNGSVALYYDNSKKFETIGAGVTVTGTTFTNQLVSSGVVTATSFSGSNTLKSRSTVIGITTSIPNNGIGNTNITGFKSYTLMKVGLSTAGWLRLYTDNASRISDASRSIGIDPSPGNGIIVEVITTGISTTQIISPFVMGGNLDDPASTTIYAAVTNLSGVTTSISVNLTLLQLEA